MPNCDRRWMPNHDRFECQTAIDSDAILQITELKKRRPASVAIVAMANKLARTVWAITAHDRKYDRNHVSIRPY